MTGKDSNSLTEALSSSHYPGVLSVLGSLAYVLLGKWCPAFLMLRHFNTVPHVVGTPNHKLFCHYCNFASVMNCTVDI